MCTRCHGPLPRFPEKARAADGTEWEFCSWRCAMVWRASQGDELALRAVAAMGWELKT